MRSARRRAEWISAQDAVQQIAAKVGGEVAAQDLISSWIGEGKLPTLAAAIEKFPADLDNWGDDDLPLADALRRGFVKVDSSRARLELTELFWAECKDWETDKRHWDWDAGNFVVGFHHDGSAEQPSFWRARRVQIKERPFTTYFSLWETSRSQLATREESSPPPKRRGRHEDPRRADWTAEVVLMARDNLIRPEMTANELIDRVETQLCLQGIWGSGVAPLDRTTVYKTAQKVVEALRSRHNPD